MHILMTADTVGGVWTYTRELVTGLSRRGHCVTLVSFGGHPTHEQKHWMRGLERLAYYPTDYRLEWMQDSYVDIQESSEWLQRLIADLQPDLLHFNQFAYGALPTRAPKIVVAHSDVVTWWVNTREEDPPDTSWVTWYRDLVSKGLSSADVVIAPSQWMLQTVSTYYPMPSQGQVVYNALSAASFECTTPKQDCVLTVGRLWDEAKQVSLLADRRHSVNIYIAGALQHPETLSGRNACRERKSGVEWLGSQSTEQLRDLYAKAAIYVGTSRYEPFGLAPLEAALSGCALLLNDIPTFRELWGDAACYFDRNNADSLAAEIQSLIGDRERRKQLAARALARARTVFSPGPMLDSYERVYNSLVTQEAYI